MVPGGVQPGDEVPTPKPALQEVAKPASSSRLGLLRCPNATSLGWGSRPSGNVDVAAADTDADAQAVVCENLLADSGESTSGSVIPMVTAISEVASSVTAEATTLKPADAKSTPTLTKNVHTSGNINKSQTKNSHDASKLDAELVNSVVGQSPRKRPRTSNSGASQRSFDDNNSRAFSQGIELVDDAAPAKSATTTHKSPYFSVTLDYEQRVDGTSGGGCQILTITYHAHDTVHESSSTTVVGTISGRAKIEVLPPQPQTTDYVQRDSSSIEEMQQTSMLSLDIFGYRMSPQRLSCNHHNIIVHRPNWMNSLPISVVHHSSRGNDTERTTLHSILRVRIHSMADDESENHGRASSNGENCYYSAYAQPSCEIRILPPNAIYPGNYTAAGSGVCTVLETWTQTLDKIINGVKDDDSDSLTKGDSTTGVEDKDSIMGMNDNRILLCGAKGVGKSNLLRYSTNRLLTASQPTSPIKHMISRVAILDIDCGQAELSPPGLLSLTIVSKPLLSEPPVHMICGGSCDHYGRKVDDQFNNIDGEGSAAHEAAYFFGDVTSKADPETYIQMVSQLMQRYRRVVKELGGNIPLLVNTDGWVKGLGYEILCGVIGVINPGHVVQIMGNTKAKSFDMSAHHQYVSVALDDDQCQHNSRIVHILQSFDESIFSTLGDNDRCRRRSLDSRSSTGTTFATASDHRVHRLCTYFLGGYNQMISQRSFIAGEDEIISFHKEKGLHDPNNIIGLTLSSMPPYAVPFHSVRIYPPPGLLDGIAELRPFWGVQGDKTCNDVLDSLNGSIVGLCCMPDAIDLPLSCCNVGTGVPILNCAGLGIIRSIDFSRRLFFVLTPVHPRLLASVTSLVGGQINLPLEFMYRGVHSDSFPYMTCCHQIISSNFGMDSCKK
ncbi:hypothetical protein ACHAXH_006234 [Discostella pseudostelligera]